MHAHMYARTQCMHTHPLCMLHMLHTSTCTHYNIHISHTLPTVHACCTYCTFPWSRTAHISAAHATHTSTRTHTHTHALTYARMHTHYTTTYTYHTHYPQYTHATLTGSSLSFGIFTCLSATTAQTSNTKTASVSLCRIEEYHYAHIHVL